MGVVGWYRKHFKLTSQQGTESKVLLRFDGVDMNADLWLNGFLIGNHPCGFTTFQCDIASLLSQPGQDNVLAVRAKTGVNSRWYSGSGIFRHVWLSAVLKTHVVLWGFGCGERVLECTMTPCVLTRQLAMSLANMS